MVFWTKKKNDTPLNSEEYEKLTKKIIELREMYEELTFKTKKIETDIANLRGRFNQRLYKNKDTEEIEEETTNTQNINNSIILPDNGLPFKRR